MEIYRFRHVESGVTHELGSGGEIHTRVAKVDGVCMTQTICREIGCYAIRRLHASQFTEVHFTNQSHWLSNLLYFE
jgi:hypothetical protein